ncbi:hypothetical protein BJ878DRAFT_163156 [Calycina marina]|uniref:AAA+ ATPase domain-containing protein n=1 Tax=Calycina marina TaxID=1763456 RepID=A0A9P8CD18_9HELO|nr:hypothetical protein BJ878DRAFT_163156 [Calycina marina]
MASDSSLPPTGLTAVPTVNSQDDPLSGEKISGESKTIKNNGDGVLPEESLASSKIIYHVKYKDAEGNVTRLKKPAEPFRLDIKESDFPVIEVHSTVLPLDEDKIKILPAPSNSTGAKSSDDADLQKSNDPDLHPENFRIGEIRLKIRSKKLLNALKAVVKYYPGQTLLGDEVSFPEPFHLLMHHRAELEEYKATNIEGHDEEYKNASNEHIDVLLMFLRDHFGKELEDEEARHKRNPPVCTFEYVWLLLKPGTQCLVYAERNTYLPYNLKKFTGGMIAGRPSTYKTYNWNMTYDGYELGRSPGDAAILPFDGEKEIDSLLIFPARYHRYKKEEDQNGPTLVERFINRGEKFWNLTKKFSYKGYDGLNDKKPYRQIKSRIMVDFETYYTKFPAMKPYIEAQWIPNDDVDGEEAGTGTSGCECEKCKDNRSARPPGLFQEYDEVDPEDDPPNRENFFFLMPRLAPSFILYERTWEYLDVTYMKDAESQTEDYSKYLVLEPKMKNDIEALCKMHVQAKQAKSASSDFIKGKGEGLIFLLHGPPGVGKTCTAECIAELLDKPLLALTCSDLGTTAESVSDSLNNYLSLGEQWGAVVLLDEADVYFAERSEFDVKRNSLVTVFLRALEYYKGLLFLTTNRVGTFDEAFKSRIHVPLLYKRLDFDQRNAIWKNCVDRAERQESIIVTDLAKTYFTEDKTVKQLDWNGREIQYAFGTALSLARFDATKEGKKKTRVKKSHVQRVVQMSRLFTQYLISTKGGKTPDQLIKGQKIRDDTHGEPSKPTRLQQKMAEKGMAAVKKKSKKVDFEEEEKMLEEKESNGDDDDSDDDDDDDDEDDYDSE